MEFACYLNFSQKKNCFFDFLHHWSRSLAPRNHSYCRTLLVNNLSVNGQTIFLTKENRGISNNATVSGLNLMSSGIKTDFFSLRFGIVLIYALQLIHTISTHRFRFSSVVLAL